MKILVTGNYDPAYNRTKILINGLKSIAEIEVVEFPIPKIKNLNKRYFKELAAQADCIYLPPFTHESVKPLSKLSNKPLIFDPLISKYLTKVFDYKQVSKYSPRAFKNYLKDKIPLHSCDLILADTAAHKKYFVDKFKVDASKVKVLPIGADVEVFKSKEKIQNTIFNVGFYGGFIPLQGTTNILDAAAILSEHQDVVFNLIGTGFEWDKMQQKALDLGLKNVNFLGWVAYDDLPSKINDFDVCLGIFGDTPKADIVIPNKIYHYAAIGKSIITKDTVAIREIFSPDSNILLCDSTGASIAEKILLLKSDDTKRRELEKASHELVSAQYSAEKIAQIFLDCIHEVLL